MPVPLPVRPKAVPAGSLQLAITFNAIGFLNEKPKADRPDFILPMAPGHHAPRRGVDVTDQDLIPFRTQAASDLKAFYAARASELASGGQLLVQVFGRRGELSTSHGIYDVLSDALLDAVEQGRLTSPGGLRAAPLSQSTFAAWRSC